jgi:hypothetical protein
MHILFSFREKTLKNRKRERKKEKKVVNSGHLVSGQQFLPALTTHVIDFKMVSDDYQDEKKTSNLVYNWILNVLNLL